MVHSYQEYLAEPKALTLEEMQEIHGEIAGEIGSDADGMELYDELMAVAVRYASIRAGWPLLSREEKMEKDSRRTSCHNSVITHLNMLARYLKQQGKKAAWRDRLGYEEDDPYNQQLAILPAGWRLSAAYAQGNINRESAGSVVCIFCISQL